jgi:hypothetical protein
MLMQHLLVDLEQVIKRQHIVLAKLQSGFVHLIQAMKF